MLCKYDQVRKRTKTCAKKLESILAGPVSWNEAEVASAKEAIAEWKNVVIRYEELDPDVWRVAGIGARSG